MILVDTNVLGRLCHVDDPLRNISLAALRSCRRRDELILVPQVLFEFWVSATRPRNVNGLGMSCERAHRWMLRFRRMFRILPDPVELLDTWQSLLLKHQTLGKQSHDARLVAAMALNSVSAILTYNTDDFSRYGVIVLDPRHS